ncbi:10565_t:CDS:2 [Diversispora eburnea]|uniref:10565_t:CDS:1 n=1 Tax=Diversispora eburnea TaxID=1213867 RepID=A0A9N9B892_9GLOM|nr:10565_t:CDS:2 [Diversispora eburnea]
MTNKIYTELWIMTLNNVKSTQDLYSSLLVNRIWCKVTIQLKLISAQKCLETITNWSIYFTQGLYIEDCYGLHKLNSLFSASSFTQLISNS